MEQTSENDLPHEASILERSRGVEELMANINGGATETRHLLLNECDVLLKCRYCHEVFGCASSFSSHKRLFCQVSHENRQTVISGQITAKNSETGQKNQLVEGNKRIGDPSKHPKWKYMSTLYTRLSQQQPLPAGSKEKMWNLFASFDVPMEKEVSPQEVLKAETGIQAIIKETAEKVTQKVKKQSEKKAARMPEDAPCRERTLRNRGDGFCSKPDTTQPLSISDEDIVKRSDKLMPHSANFSSLTCLHASCYHLLPFASIAALAYHVTIRHVVQKSKEKQRTGVPHQIKCLLCNITLKSRDNLRFHMISRHAKVKKEHLRKREEERKRGGVTSSKSALRRGKRNQARRVRSLSPSSISSGEEEEGTEKKTRSKKTNALKGTEEVSLLGENQTSFQESEIYHKQLPVHQVVDEESHQQVPIAVGMEDECSPSNSSASNQSIDGSIRSDDWDTDGDTVSSKIMMETNQPSRTKDTDTEKAVMDILKTVSNVICVEEKLSVAPESILKEEEVEFPSKPRCLSEKNEQTTISAPAEMTEQKTLRPKRQRKRPSWWGESWGKTQRKKRINCPQENDAEGFEETQSKKTKMSFPQEKDADSLEEAQKKKMKISIPEEKEAEGLEKTQRKRTKMSLPQEKYADKFKDTPVKKANMSCSQDEADSLEKTQRKRKKIRPYTPFVYLSTHFPFVINSNSKMSCSQEKNADSLEKTQRKRKKMNFPREKVADSLNKTQKKKKKRSCLQEKEADNWKETKSKKTKTSCPQEKKAHSVKETQRKKTKTSFPQEKEVDSCEETQRQQTKMICSQENEVGRWEETHMTQTKMSCLQKKEAVSSKEYLRKKTKTSSLQKKDADSLKETHRKNSKMSSPREVKGDSWEEKQNNNTEVTCFQKQDADSWEETQKNCPDENEAQIKKKTREVENEKEKPNTTEDSLMPPNEPENSQEKLGNLNIRRGERKRPSRIPMQKDCSFSTPPMSPKNKQQSPDSSRLKDPNKFLYTPRSGKLILHQLRGAAEESKKEVEDCQFVERRRKQNFENAEEEDAIEIVQLVEGQVQRRSDLASVPVFLSEQQQNIFFAGLERISCEGERECYECKYCKRRMPNIRDGRRHMVAHLRVMRLRCALCYAGAFFCIDMRNHLQMRGCPKLHNAPNGIVLRGNTTPCMTKAQADSLSFFAHPTSPGRTLFTSGKIVSIISSHPYLPDPAIEESILGPSRVVPDLHARKKVPLKIIKSTMSWSENIKIKEMMASEQTASTPGNTCGEAERTNGEERPQYHEDLFKKVESKDMIIKCVRREDVESEADIKEADSSSSDARSLSAGSSASAGGPSAMGPPPSGSMSGRPNLFKASNRTPRYIMEAVIRQQNAATSPSTALQRRRFPRGGQRGARRRHSHKRAFSRISRWSNIAADADKMPPEDKYEDFYENQEMVNPSAPGESALSGFTSEEMRQLPAV